MSQNNQTEPSQIFKGIIEINGETYNTIQEIYIRDNIIKRLKTEILELNRIQESKTNILKDLNEKNRRFQEDIKILKTELFEANEKYILQEKVMKTNKKRMEELSEDYDEVKAKLEHFNELYKKQEYTNAFLRRENENLKRDLQIQHLDSIRANNKTKIDYEKQLASFKQEMVCHVQTSSKTTDNSKESYSDRPVSSALSNDVTIEVFEDNSVELKEDKCIMKTSENNNKFISLLHHVLLRISYHWNQWTRTSPKVSHFENYI